MADGAHTHHCPFCELKFLFITEVRDHVITDHREHAASFQGMAPSEAEPHPLHAH
jgi:hypothetical protein